MGDARTMARQVNTSTVSTVHRDITDRRFRELRRPRKVCFYVNGDRYFKGKKLYITPHRYLNFNDLLTDLTGKLPSKANLPYGVRQIFTPVAGHRVTDIEELGDGSSYVCGGFEAFKPVHYGQERLEQWSFGRPHNHDFRGYDYGDGDGYGGGYSSYPGRGYYGHNAFRPGKQLHGSYPRKNYPPATFGHRDYLMHSEGANAKPKVITIVRNGPKPRSTVKMLLNRRSVQSFEQLMGDVAEAFGPKWKNDKVRKLYTIKGRAVQSVSDFFRDDDVFIGVGNEKLTEGNVQDIIAELYPDNPYAQNLLKDYEKNNRRNKYTIKDPYDTGKDDSGLGDGSDHKDPSENEYVIYKGRPHFRDGRRMDQERGLAAKDERARAHRRRKKMLDAERRALEEERRKRGLVGKKDDPFKKMKEQKLREQREREDARRKEEEDERRRRQEEEDARRRKGDEDRDREDAERRARERQKAADDEARRKREADGDREARERAEKAARDRAAKEKADRDREKADRDREAREREQREKEARDKAERDRQAAANKPKEKAPRERNIGTDDDVLKKYEQGRTLGDGNFAIVKQAKMKATGNDYAMKIIDKAKLKGKQQMVDNEIDIMKECAHPNIVKLYEDYETKDKIYLIEELVKGGDLFDAITQSVKFGERDSASMVKDLCSALFYLHARNIVHRDLKPENLLVCRNKDATISLKLADFGLAMEVTEPIYAVCGTPTYVAPEILSEVGYGVEVDMWAVGVIAFILLCGFPPFRSADRNQTELFEFIKAGEFDFLSPYWDSISSTAKDIVEKLLVVNIAQRFTATDTLCHPWILGGGDLSSLSQDELKKLREKGLDLRQELNREANLAWENWQNRRK